MQIAQLNVYKTKILATDPTHPLTQKVKKILSQMNKNNRFTKKDSENIYPSDPIPPRMYGSIKAHKPEKGYPMRIIVSTIGTVTYGISEYLVKIIQSTLNKSEVRIKNSTTFVNEAKHWNISNNEVQVSYDVVNLYPSIPLQEATDVILNMISQHPEVKRRTK